MTFASQLRGGGSLLIAWQLKDKHVLIVGGGEVASQRVESLLTSDAHITILSPDQGLHPKTRNFIQLEKDRITYHDRSFQGSDELNDVDMVLTAVDDPELSRTIVVMSRERRIPANAADLPELCDFYFGAQIRDGPLQIMISTNGNGPRMASLIKSKVQKSLSGLEGQAVTKVGLLRNKLKEKAPGVGGQVGKERMKWMNVICNEWEVEEFAVLDDFFMDKLLEEGWDKGKRVPSAHELGIHSTEAQAVGPIAVIPIIPAMLSFVAGAFFASLFLTFRKKY